VASANEGKASAMMATQYDLTSAELLYEKSRLASGAEPLLTALRGWCSSA